MSLNSGTVFIVDDDRSICVATERLLRAEGFQVRTSQDTRSLFLNGRPAGRACLVLDLRVPGENGLEFQRRLQDRGIRIPIIFISGHGDIASSVQAMKAGAVDFLTKPFDAEDLLTAVRNALETDSRSLSFDHHLNDLRSRYETLTEREREVFPAVAAGLLNKQVASELGIAEKTVKVHRAHVMDKMGAIALTDLVRMADLLGLEWNSSDNTPEYAYHGNAETVA